MEGRESIYKSTDIHYTIFILQTVLFENFPSNRRIGRKYKEAGC